MNIRMPIHIEGTPDFIDCRIRVTRLRSTERAAFSRAQATSTSVFGAVPSSPTISSSTTDSRPREFANRRYDGSVLEPSHTTKTRLFGARFPTRRRKLGALRPLPATTTHLNYLRPPNALALFAYVV